MISEIGKIIPVPLLELDTNSHASALHAAFDRLFWLVQLVRLARLACGASKECSPIWTFYHVRRCLI